jgi:hypothetical protein
MKCPNKNTDHFRELVKVFGNEDIAIFAWETNGQMFPQENENYSRLVDVTGSKEAALKEIFERNRAEHVAPEVNSQPNEQTDRLNQIEELFKDSPELANIGTKAQYMQYLSTIFKTSKVKDIVYHGTGYSFNTFKSDKNEFIFFTKSKEYASIYAQKGMEFLTQMKPIIEGSVEKYNYLNKAIYESSSHEAYKFKELLNNLIENGYDSKKILELIEISRSVKGMHSEFVEPNYERNIINEDGDNDIQAAEEAFFKGPEHEYWKEQEKFRKNEQVADKIFIFERTFEDTISLIKKYLKSETKRLNENGIFKLNRNLKEVKPSQNLYSSILNIQNPQFVNFEISNETIKENLDKLDNTKDSIIGKEAILKAKLSTGTKWIDNAESIAVKSPEQIHILGSKQDVEGFKEFVSDDKDLMQSPEELQQSEEEYEEIVNYKFKNAQLTNDVEQMRANVEDTTNKLEKANTLQEKLEIINSIQAKNSPFKKITARIQRIKKVEEQDKAALKLLFSQEFAKLETMYQQIQLEYIDELLKTEEIKGTKLERQLMFLKENQNVISDFIDYYQKGYKQKPNAWDVFMTKYKAFNTVGAATAASVVLGSAIGMTTAVALPLVFTGFSTAVAATFIDNFVRANRKNQMLNSLKSLTNISSIFNNRFKKNLTTFLEQRINELNRVDKLKALSDRGYNYVNEYSDQIKEEVANYDSKNNQIKKATYRYILNQISEDDIFMQAPEIPSEYTNHSGGAYGGDTFWDLIGREFGVTNHKHYKDAGNQNVSQQLKNKGVKAEILTKDQMDFARQKVKELLGIDYSIKSTDTEKQILQKNLQVRNFYQVYNADAVYAVAKLNGSPEFNVGSVFGGTNTAVQLGIKLNKPVYLWDIDSEQWMKYENNIKDGINIGEFKPTNTPVLTKDFAGIGSRDIENYNVQKDGKWVPRAEYVGKEKEEKAKQAIRDVYEKTLFGINDSGNKKEVKNKIVHMGPEFGNYYKFELDPAGNAVKGWYKQGNNDWAEMNSKRVFTKHFELKAAGFQELEGVDEVIKVVENQNIKKLEKAIYSSESVYEFPDGVKIQLPFALNEQQASGLREMYDFYNDPGKYGNKISLVGYAGTGKSTLISLFDKYLLEKRRRPVYSSPTHKANSVTLKNNNTAEVYTLQAYFGMAPFLDLENSVYSLDKLRFEQQSRRAKLKHGDLLIIDEASMIQDSVYDLINEAITENQLKVIYVGDDAQLDPPGNNGMSKVFLDPELHKIKLTKVERTGNNSILKNSMMIREQNAITNQTEIKNGIGVKFFNKYEDAITKEIIDHAHKAILSQNPDYFKILSATDASSNMVSKYNQAIRKGLGFNKPFELNEIVTGYTNKGEAGIRNGFDYIVNYREESVVKIDGVQFNGIPLEFKTISITLDDRAGNFVITNVVHPDEDLNKIDLFAKIVAEIGVEMNNYYKAGQKSKYYDLKVLRESLLEKLDFTQNYYRDFRGNLTTEKTTNGVSNSFVLSKTLDYGYAVTIHKSQGSTYDVVVVDDITIQSFKKTKDQQKLRYVGVSRAKSKVYYYTNATLKQPEIITNDAEDVDFVEINPVEFTQEEVNTMFTAVDMNNLQPNDKVAIAHFVNLNNGEHLLENDPIAQAILNGNHTSIDELLAESLISEDQHRMLSLAHTEPETFEQKSRTYSATDFTRDNKGNIIDLPPNHLFAFGSNTGSSTGGAPTHGAGSAQYARKYFGAIQGQFRGHVGRSYAIVTKKYWDVYRSSTPDEIIKEIKDFYDYAENNPNLTFVVAYSGDETKIENNSGYTNKQLGQMFAAVEIPPNVMFEENFSKLLVYSEETIPSQPFKYYIDGSKISDDGSLTLNLSEGYNNKQYKIGETVLIYDNNGERYSKISNVNVDFNTDTVTLSFEQDIQQPEQQDTTKERKQPIKEPIATKGLKNNSVVFMNHKDILAFLDKYTDEVEKKEDGDIENMYAPISGTSSPRTVSSAIKSINLQPIKDTYKIAKLRKEDKITSFRSKIASLNEKLKSNPNNQQLLNEVKRLRGRIARLEKDISSIEATSKNIQNTLYVDELMLLYQEDIKTLKEMLITGNIDTGDLAEGLELLKMWGNIANFKVEHPLFDNQLMTDYSEGNAPLYLRNLGSYFEKQLETINNIYNMFMTKTAELVEKEIQQEYGENAQLLDDTFKDPSFMKMLFLSLNRIDHPLFHLLHKKQKVAEWRAKNEADALVEEIEKLVEELSKSIGIVEAFNMLKEKFDDNSGRNTGSLVHEFKFEWNYELNNLIKNTRTVRNHAELEGAINALFRSGAYAIDGSAGIQTNVAHLISVGYDPDIALKYATEADEKYNQYLLESHDVAVEFGPNSLAFQQWSSKHDPTFKHYLHNYHKTSPTEHVSFYSPSFRYSVLVTLDPSNLSDDFKKVKANPALYKFFSHIVEMQQTMLEMLPVNERDKYFGNALPFTSKELMENLLDGSIKASSFRDSYINAVVEENIEDFSIYDIEGNKEERIMMRHSPFNEDKINADVAAKLTVWEMENDQLRINDPGLYLTKRTEAKKQFFKDVLDAISKEKSFDIASVLKKFALFTFAYKYKIDMIDLHRSAEELFDATLSDVENIAGKPVERFGGRKVVKKKALSNAMEMYEMQKRSFYNYHLYDHIHVGDKKYLKSEQDIIDDLKKTAKEAEEKFQQTGNKYYEDVAETAKKQMENLGRNVVHDNKIDIIIRITQLLGLGWAFIGGISNVIQAITSSLIQAGTGHYFNEESYIKALKRGLHGSLKNYSFNAIETQTAKRTRAVMDFYGLLKESKNAVYERTSSNVGFLGKIKKKLSFARFYNANTRGEYFAQSVEVNAMLLYKTVIDPQGNTVPLDEALDQNGRVKPNYAYTFTNDSTGMTITLTTQEEIENKIKTMADDMIMTSQGNYSTDSPIVAQKTVYGRAFIMFKKWLFENTNQRIGPEMINRESGKIVKGRYRSAIPISIPLGMLFPVALPLIIPTNKYMGIKTIFALNIYALKRLLKILTLGKYKPDDAVFNGMMQVDIDNIKATMNEALLHTTIMLTMLALKYLYSDTEDERTLRILKFLTNLTNRTKQDLELYLNWDQMKNTVGTYDKLFPILSNVTKLDKWIDSLADQFSDDPNINSGYWRGHNSLMINTLKFTPGANKMISYPQYFDRIFDPEIAKEFRNFKEDK